MHKFRPQLNLRRLLLIIGALLVVWLLVAVVLAAAVVVYGQADQSQPADVIIVLGSGLERNNRAGPALTRRARHAASLWREGYAPYIICTGGYALGRPRSEADACREVLVNHGVAAEAVILEEQSRSTEENAYFTRSIMDSNGWNTALLVSEGYHLLRATWIFNDTGIQLVGHSPAESPPFFRHVSAVGREVVALHWQFVKELLNLPFTYVPLV